MKSILEFVKLAAIVQGSLVVYAASSILDKLTNTK